MSIRAFAEATPNNTINADSEKRREKLAPLFTAGYGERYVSMLSSQSCVILAAPISSL